LNKNQTHTNELPKTTWNTYVVSFYPSYFTFQQN
jgi:hypothetical protein